MKKITQRLKGAARKAAFAVAGSAASAGAFALETTDIEAAMSSGETAYGTVVAGVIALAAIGVAVGLVLSMMKRT